MNRIKKRDTDRGELVMDPQLADCDRAGDRPHRDRSGDGWDYEHQDFGPQDLDLDLNGDRLREECGVFGIYGPPDPAAITALRLHPLPPRRHQAPRLPTSHPPRLHPTRPLRPL